MGPRGLFITGTDTGVGKTRVASALARCLRQTGRRVGVLKPVTSGAERRGEVLIPSDALLLLDAIDREAPREAVAPLIFEAGVAPAVAAILAGEPLRFEQVESAAHTAIAWWRERCEVLIVEGTGGLLTPIAQNATVADLAVALGFPLLIVARRSLGTLNHTLLTVEAARSRGLSIAGLVFNEVEPNQIAAAEGEALDDLIPRLEGVPILGRLSYRDDPTTLSVAVRFVEWYDVAAESRAHAFGADVADELRTGSVSSGRARQVNT